MAQNLSCVHVDYCFPLFAPLEHIRYFLTSVCLDCDMFCKQDECGEVFHMSNSSAFAQLDLRSHHTLTVALQKHI